MGGERGGQIRPKRGRGAVEMSDTIGRYRPLIVEDLAGISAVHRRACLIAYAFMNWAYSEAEVRAWYAGKFPEWDWGEVAEDATHVVGFIATTGTHIDQLFVDPDFQKCGIGTALLTSALRGIPAATLNVFEQNVSARRFYERHGFREIDRVFNAAEKAIELTYRRERANVTGASLGS
jgi:putative acetyltransferase